MVTDPQGDNPRSKGPVTVAQVKKTVRGFPGF